MANRFNFLVQHSRSSNNNKKQRYADDDDVVVVDDDDYYDSSVGLGSEELGKEEAEQQQEKLSAVFCTGPPPVIHSVDNLRACAKVYFIEQRNACVAGDKCILVGGEEQEEEVGGSFLPQNQWSGVSVQKQIETCSYFANNRR